MNTQFYYRGKLVNEANHTSFEHAKEFAMSMRKCDQVTFLCPNSGIRFQWFSIDAKPNKINWKNVIRRVA